jgi:hypothetical protein
VGRTGVALPLRPFDASVDPTEVRKDAGHVNAAGGPIR